MRRRGRSAAQAMSDLSCNLSYCRLLQFIRGVNLELLN